MPSPTFLQVVKDHTQPIWCVSLIGMPNQGYAFLIVCNSKQEADNVVLSISNGARHYPTVNPQGYQDISEQYPHMQSLTKIFCPT